MTQLAIMIGAGRKTFRSRRLPGTFLSNTDSRGDRG
jgi:hypothetical protein